MSDIKTPTVNKMPETPEEFSAFRRLPKAKQIAIWRRIELAKAKRHGARIDEQPDYDVETQIALGADIDTMSEEGLLEGVFPDGVNRGLQEMWSEPPSPPIDFVPTKSPRRKKKR